MGNKPDGLLLLQMWCCLLLFAKADDCPYKGCQCYEAEINCEGLQLKAIPKISGAITSGNPTLLFFNNEITTISAQSLVPSLAVLNLNENPITTINDIAFDGSARTLATLAFSNARFTRIPNAFSHLYALKELDLVSLNITDWNFPVWSSFNHTLQSLYLHNVGLTTWPMFIQNFTNLQELTIGVGSISSIPDNALDSMVDTLISLSLDGNSLTMIPKAMSKLKRLQTLYLEHNRITDLTWFPKNSQLSSVSLGNNYISNAVQLSQVLRPYGRSLITMGIEYNHLTGIPDMSYLIQMLALDFTYNRISDPTSGNAPADLNVLQLSFNDLPLVPRMFSILYNVTYIDLSNNAIKAIRETDFHNRTISLDLSYNLITQLSDTSFPEQFGLQYLTVNYNPLTYISPGALQRLINLQGLSLNHSKLTRLPVALHYLNKLFILDVSDSPDLVCTCLESGLRPWIMKYYEYDIMGNCGSTTIYYFYDKLSLQCPTSR